MGCWNQTCGITQLPIHAGEKVVSFLLVNKQREEPANICYTAKAWKPIYIPLYGEYDDYGYQNMDEGQEWKFKFLDEHLNDCLIEHPGEGSTNYTITEPLSKENHPFLDWEMIKEHMHRGTLKLINRYNDVGAVGLMMIKLGVFNTLISFDVERYKKVFKDFGKFVINNQKKEKSPFNSPIMQLMEFEESYTDDKEYSKLLPHSVFGVSMDGGFIDDYSIQDVGNTQLLESLAESLCLHTSLYELRKMWQPQCGQGSQSSLNFKHAIFLQAYNTAYNNLVNEHNEQQLDWYPDSADLIMTTKLEFIENRV